MKNLLHLTLALTLVLLGQSAYASHTPIRRIMDDLQRIKVTPLTYPIVEKKLETLKSLRMARGLSDIDRRTANKRIREVEADLKKVLEQMKKESSKEQTELTLQDQDIQDLLLGKNAIAALLSKPLTDDSRKELEGLISLFEDAVRRLEKRGQLRVATAFLDLAPETTTNDYITNVRAAMTTEQDKVAALKQADKIFADIVLKTPDSKISPQMLISAQKALADFQTLSAQLNEQERTRAKELLGGLDFATYIGQMKKTYIMRLNKMPDALSLSLQELKEERTKTEKSEKEEKEGKEAKEKVSAGQKTIRAEDNLLARQQRVSGSSLPSPEFQLSFNDKTLSTQFSELGIVGNSISPTYYGIPMIGHYADTFGYQMLTRVALIEYVFTDKTKKQENLIPTALKKIIDTSGVTPELYACIWIKPKDHTFDDYNLVYHTVLGAWTGKTYLNLSPEMGIFGTNNVNCNTANPVSCESLKATEVNWHADAASKLGAFSPNNARFILEKAPLATFWSYMAYSQKSIIIFNVIITNPDLKDTVDKIVNDNWTFNALSGALKPIIGNGPVQTLVDLAKDSLS